MFCIDSTRSAFWNIDNVVGSVRRNQNEIKNLIVESKNDSTHSFLFLDAVKRYFNKF